MCALYAASAAISACSISCVHIVLSCHGCRAGYGAQLLARCLCGCPTMWARWQGVFHTTRWKQANPLCAGQKWHSSVEAACWLVTECHRPSLPSKIFSSGPNPCREWMSGGRCVGRDTQSRQRTRHHDV
ncbi:hypothetical protein TcCL_NonESM11784 [Trypanosoma cruzi]|nr:hypothetical protein TcCL_NonESM11784 [Trypanosoma cruzi]